MGGTRRDTVIDDQDDLAVAGVGVLRLDKWLWFARVVKSRTLAAGLISDGRVRINSVRVEKPSATVKAGDVLTIGIHARVMVLEVVSMGVRRGPAPEAQALYRDISPPPPPKELAVPIPAEREAGAGRPTKRDRRKIIGFTDDR